MANFTDDIEDREAEFSFAPEVEKIARTLIPQYHPHLKTAKIKYLFTSKPMRDKGRLVLGKAQLAAPLVKFFGKCDFVVIMSLIEWSDGTEKERLARTDHELCHCSFKVSEKGVRSWAIRGHDIEEFNEILERHGLHSQSLSVFAETMQQLSLFEAPTSRKKRK